MPGSEATNQCVCRVQQVGPVPGLIVGFAFKGVLHYKTDHPVLLANSPSSVVMHNFGDWLKGDPFAYKPTLH
jgi:hypothetical protein